MDSHVKVGGAWKRVVRPHVKVGGAWKGVTAAYVKVAGAWKQTYRYLNVTMPNITLANQTAGECDSFVKIDNDGDYYESTAAGTYGASSGTWLDRGTTAEVWVERTITQGSLDLDTIGASRVATTTDREIGVTRVAPGITTPAAIVVLDFYDAASSGNLLDTATITLTAENNT